MKTFRIIVERKIHSYLDIEAEDQEEADKIAENAWRTHKDLIDTQNSSPAKIFNVQELKENK